MSAAEEQCPTGRPSAGIARFIPLVAITGAVGLAMSVWLLSGYATPLLRLLKGLLQ